MPSTKTDAELAAAAAEHADDPERAELLQRARRFKASWLELAEALTDVRRNGQWKRWGHASFEDYAKKELHLRPETVDKLTGSFSFLKRHAPAVLERDGVDARIPSYQAIDFLRRAESQAGAPPAAVEEIRRRVLDEGASFPAVTRELRDKVFPIDERARRERDAAGIKNVASKLRELLADTKAIPRKLAAEATEALERVLEAIADGEERAA